MKTIKCLIAPGACLCPLYIILTLVFFCVQRMAKSAAAMVNACAGSVCAIATMSIISRENSVKNAL